jgi:antitoxin (DNA-binding transcriptional repressor) of toxin-antitoxin stability system
MRVVGLRELKNRLSEYIRQVRAGESVFITDRGAVVAEIRPPGRLPEDLVDPGIASLAKRDLLVSSAKNDPQVYPLLPRALKHCSSRRLLDEERGRR